MERSIKELMNLSGRTALITGGAGHIGGTIANALAESQASIAILDIEPEACRVSAERLANVYEIPTLAVPCDLADEKALCRIPELIYKELGGLDILVHSAAFVGTSNLDGWVTPFDRQSAATWRQALEVNLTSVFVLSQAAATFLSAKGLGSVICISSIYGMLGPNLDIYEGTEMGNPAAYAASKGGLIQLSRYMATVLAPSIRVNSISLGGVSRGQPEVFQKRYCQRTPLSRMGIEEDIKGAAVYLAGDMSAYVTGHNLVVDGGWSVW